MRRLDDGQGFVVAWDVELLGACARCAVSGSCGRGATALPLTTMEGCAGSIYARCDNALYCWLYHRYCSSGGSLIYR